MLVNPNIFKSYDIRGIFGKEFDNETAYKLGAVFVDFTKAKKIAVAYDARLSSPLLYDSLVKGIVDGGASVLSLKMAPTECLYFSVGKYNCDAGIMITASHNPKEYNGFKMIVNKNSDISIIRGEDIKEAFNNFNLDSLETKEKGEIKELDFKKDFLDHIFSLINVDKIKSLKVVVDIGNGAMGEIATEASKITPISLIPINFNPDGNFYSRSPNPLELGASDAIRKKIIEEKADIGFMFDGDGDRVFVVNEKGEFVSADISLLLIAKVILEKYPNSAISYNAICSKAVPYFIEKWGGNPIRTKVGFVNVREAIIRENGSMGGELSGHYCFKDNFYLDSGIIAYLLLLQLFSEEGRPVSSVVEEFMIYSKSESNFKVENKEKVLEGIKNKYSDGKQDFLDGITIEYSTWWFNLRASQTEPLLRFTIEADTKELLEEKKKEITEFIENSK